ncbi:MAG TPA: hypothetical protein VFO19_07740 [Vicinamibacterales bacterium]|nr:hypothetical protein [Vicinamibacterales bacterium]
MQPAEDASKRRIWLTIMFAHVRYRLEDYDEATRYLQGALNRLNSLDPHQEHFFGTRARLSYSFGQVARQRQRYEEALGHFTDVSEFAAERLREKTPFLELHGPPRLDHQLDDAQQKTLQKERVLATWTIGKSLAFGVGWIHYTTGNLRVARLAINAGYAMLRPTGDWIHRAYAQLLLAAAERARGGGDSRRLAKAVNRVAESEAGLAAHPSFSGRAAYERALCLLHMKDPAGARAAIARARAHFDAAARTPSPRRSDPGGQVPKATRWLCSLFVLESRAHRLEGRKPDAIRAAGQAYTKAVEGRHISSQIDALLARAEVAIEPDPDRAGGPRRKDELGRAVSDIHDAQALLQAHPNPKMEAACCLHLARAHWRLEQHAEARQFFGIWLQEYADRVQHGFLHTLADEIADEIAVTGDRFSVLCTTENLNFAQHEARLRAFLIKTAGERARTPADQARLLGVGERTLRQWIHDLGGDHDVGKRRE